MDYVFRQVKLGDKKELAIGMYSSSGRLNGLNNQNNSYMQNNNNHHQNGFLGAQNSNQFNYNNNSSLVTNGFNSNTNMNFLSNSNSFNANTGMFNNNASRSSLGNNNRQNNSYQQNSSTFNNGQSLNVQSLLGPAPMSAVSSLMSAGSYVNNANSSSHQNSLISITNPSFNSRLNTGTVSFAHHIQYRQNRPFLSNII